MEFTIQFCKDAKPKFFFFFPLPTGLGGDYHLISFSHSFQVNPQACLLPLFLQATPKD